MFVEKFSPESFLYFDTTNKFIVRENIVVSKVLLHYRKRGIKSMKNKKNGRKTNNSHKKKCKLHIVEVIAIE